MAYSVIELWNGTQKVGVTNSALMIWTGPIDGNGYPIVSPTALTRTTDSIDIKDTGGVTHSSITVGTSNINILPINANRKFLMLQSDGSPIYASFGVTANVNQGFRLGASVSPIIFQERWMFTQSLNAIANGITATLLVTEG